MFLFHQIKLLFFFVKKIFAILLLCVFAFNLVGYRFVFTYLESNADVALQQRLDAHAYKATDLFEVKVPLNLPYFQNYTAYERYDGTAEVNGVYYNYVNRQIVNDTLIMYCIRNNHETHLKFAENEYGSISTQNNNAAKTNQALLFSMLVIGSPVHSVSYDFSFINFLPKYSSPKNNDAACSAFVASHYQPPETINFYCN